MLESLQMKITSAPHMIEDNRRALEPHFRGKKKEKRLANIIFTAQTILDGWKKQFNLNSPNTEPAENPSDVPAQNSPVFYPAGQNANCQDPLALP
jgi:hypothetical protein